MGPRSYLSTLLAITTHYGLNFPKKVLNRIGSMDSITAPKPERSIDRGATAKTNAKARYIIRAGSLRCTSRSRYAHLIGEQSRTRGRKLPHRAESPGGPARLLVLPHRSFDPPQVLVYRAAGHAGASGAAIDSSAVSNSDLTAGDRHARHSGRENRDGLLGPLVRCAGTRPLHGLRDSVDTRCRAR